MKKTDRKKISDSRKTNPHKRKRNNKNSVVRKNNKKRKKNLILAFIIAIFFVAAAVGAAVCIINSGDTVNVEKENSSTEKESENTDTESKSTTQEQTMSQEELNKQKAEDILSDMTIEEKINQMFIVTPESLTGTGQVIAAGDTTKNAIKNHPVGGIIYFSQNFTGEEETKTMISNTKKFASEYCKVPMFISVDEEGGTVARLGNNGTINVPRYDNMSVIGKTGDTSKAYEVGRGIGQYLSEYGFNLDFAPVADVLTNSANLVVKDRSFGSDANVVSQMSQNFSKGLNEQGVLSCYKHFPGHGATKEDSHKGFAYVNKSYEQLQQSELIPFVDAINTNADFIMVGHISLPEIIGDDTPASVSPVAVNDILKSKLGYKGIIITDSLSMEALTNLYQSDEIAVRTVKAGVDMLLMPLDFEQAYNGLLKAVKSGEISEERIDESVRKILNVKLNM